MDRAIFFAEIRKAPFGGRMSKGQVAGVEAMLDGWKAFGPHDQRWAAYALATAFHETATTMQPIREIGRGKGKPYGAPAGRHKQSYYGRGLVQLTWERNYRDATERLRARGVIGSADDLTRTPDLAMRPDIAVAILVHGMVEGWFTGRKLGDYFRGSRSDWVDARTIINGHDRDRLVASYGMLFYHALGAAHAAEAVA